MHFPTICLRKTFQQLQILMHFRKYSTNIEPNLKILQTFLNENDLPKITMSPLRLEGCVFGDSFSKAQLEVVQYLVDRDGAIRSPLFTPSRDVYDANVGTYGVDFQALFSKGFGDVRKFIDGDLDVDRNHDNHKLRIACENLSTFFKDKEFHRDCLLMLDEYNWSWKWKHKVSAQCVSRALLANHVISPLAGGPRGGGYFSSDNGSKIIFCPCNNNGCDTQINYEGFAFGSEFLWFGKPDIAVFPFKGGWSLNVVIPPTLKSSKLENDEYNEREDDEETNIGPSVLRNRKNVKQIVSQAITFAFLLKKYQVSPPNSSTFFVPTVAASAGSFDIYLYDVNNDILLRNVGDPIQFWRGHDINLTSILYLWMMINHSLLRSDLSKQDVLRLKDTCGLRNFMDETRLKLIEETLCMKQEFVSFEMPELKDLQYFHETVP